MQFYAHPNEDRSYIADKLTAARQAKRCREWMLRNLENVFASTS